MFILKKTITIFCCNYYPEDSAIGLYTTQLMRFLSEKNYHIKVVTGFPNYPFWKIFQGYESNPNFFKETIDQIDIYRYKQFIPKNINFSGRVLMMLSLTLGSLINSLKIKNTNLTICIIPYTFLLLPAAFFAWRKSSKLILHVQDFEFDLAFESGISKDSLLLQLLKKPVFLVEQFLLKRADFISTISNNMMEVGRKKTGKNIVYFPNWISESNINSNQFKQHPFVNAEKFTILYSGNIGEKQDWNCLIELAKKIQNSNTIEIVIVGSGAYVHTLKQQVKDFPFIKMFDPVPYADLNDLLCSADLHFLFQKTDVLDTVMPSKLLAMMASEKPSIVTGNVNSEVKNIFEKSSCGIFLSTNSIADLHNNIMTIYNDKALQSQMGSNAKKFVLQHFSQEKVLNNYHDQVIKTAI